MSTKRIEIPNRYTNTCQWAGDIEDTGSAHRNLGAAIKAALLTGADLTDAVLRDADLRDADLRDADLRGADLTGADLTGADLRGAILTGADRWKADVAALRRQVKRRESPDWVTVREKWWTVAQILANAWRRHPLTCEERDKLVAEWDALRSGEAQAVKEAK